MMVEEATVFCGSCGGALSATARFCRSCGASQVEFATQQVVASPPPAPVHAPQPPPVRPAAPSIGALPQSRTPANRTGAFLAIAGGIGMCFMVLYAIVYLPLHIHSPVLFGEGPQFGDVLAFGCGGLAIWLGVLALRRPPANPRRAGAVVMAAGVPAIILVLVWAFPETLGLDELFSRPFYFGYVYLCELGNVHIGDSYGNGYLQVPLLVSSAAVLAGGCLMAFARRERTSATIWQ
jgi:hypothetical protein